MEIVRIHYNGAFTKRPISRYNFDTKEWTDNKNPICWSGGLFEHKYNILTGRYFNQCHLPPYKINKGWTPRPTITASDYTHLFGYLNPYYRSAYNVSKRRK